MYFFSSLRICLVFIYYNTYIHGHNMALLTSWGNKKKPFRIWCNFPSKVNSHTVAHTPSVLNFFFASHEAKLSMKKTGILFFAPAKVNLYKSCGELSLSVQCTEVRFASFLSGGFSTMAVRNPPERKLEKRISV